MALVSNIGFISLRTEDLERAIGYYEEVLGLTVTDRDRSRAYLALGSGPHSIVIEAGDRAVCNRLGFQVGSEYGFEEVAKAARREGASTILRSDPGPGIARALTLIDPNGTEVDVYATAEPLGRPFSEKGVLLLKLGHVAFFTPDLKRTVAWYRDVLGFRESDWFGDFFAFLRCGPDHHTINLIRHDRPGMHHLAFELIDVGHIISSCDLLARHGHPLLWGPVRHGVGHNISTYHRNRDGQIVELFTELDRMENESHGFFEPRPWHEDHPQRPKVWAPDDVRGENLWGVRSPPGFLQG